MGCSQPISTQASISVTVIADQHEYPVILSAGSTVRQAVGAAGINLGELDRVEPALSNVLSAGDLVKVTRVTEELYTLQVAIPFEHQQLKNEALPEGESLLSQAGSNGLKEITYRRVFEDGREVSDNPIQATVLQEAVPEIEMVGTQSLLQAVALPGKLAYLSAGNAWVMQNTTADRHLVVSTGDLDGRVFSLSPDGRYLLFTRFASNAHAINTMWMADLQSTPARMVDLQVGNVVHYAQFNSTSTRLAYSTANWREGTPGWQANNDLNMMGINQDGTLNAPVQLIQPNSGGMYGWWGTNYSWSPAGLRFLVVQPDGLGLFDARTLVQVTLLDVTPYQTGGNWAWEPGVAWSPDEHQVYAVAPVTSGSDSSGTPESFDLIAISLPGGMPVTLVEDVGMFAYPVTSPSSARLTSTGYSLAYLQAVHPSQSETSTYRLYTINPDGSKQNALFPPADTTGISPQIVVWSPSSIDQAGNFGIALVYNGNIWIIDSGTGNALQITGDGLASRVDWR